MKTRVLKQFYTVLGLQTFSLLFGAVSYAQNLPVQLPGSVEAGRMNERMQAQDDQERANIIAPKNAAVSDEIPFAQDGFVLGGVELLGVSAFESLYFDALINEYVGREVDFNVLNHLAARITARYRDSGYFISRAVIPQQVIGSDAVVQIQVIEGFVNEVNIDDPGNILRGDRLEIASQTIEKLKNLKPLHGPTFERYLLTLNQHRGVFVQSILEAPQGGVGAGSVNVILKVEPSPDIRSVSYNNFGSRFVGPHQSEIFWSSGDILTAFDTLDMQIGASLPFREMQFGSLRYSAMLNANGLNAFTRLSYSNSKPGHTLKILEVESDATTVEAGLEYSLVKSRRENFNTRLSFNMQNSATEFLDQELIDDKVRYIKLGAFYDRVDNAGGYHNLDIELRKGLDILGATKTGSRNLSRQQGRSDFFTAKATARSVKRYKDLLFDASVSGQYAPHPLLSSQEFGYGGIGYGRAYDSSEITGENGLAAGVELRYQGLDAPREIHPSLSVTPFIFYDIGKVWNKERSNRPQSGASSGFGAHFSLGENYSGTLQASYPLTREVSTPMMNNKNSPRILMNLNVRF